MRPILNNLSCFSSCFTFLFLFTFPALSWCSGGEFSLNKHFLSVPGKARNFIPADFNGDGLLDILVVHTPEASGYPSGGTFASLFLQKTGGFSEVPHETWRLRKDAVFIDAGRIGKGATLPQVFLMTPHDVWYHEWRDGGLAAAPQRLASVESLVPGPDTQTVRAFDFVRDIDGDGSDEMMVPGLNHLKLFDWEKTGKHRIETIDLRTMVYVSTPLDLKDQFDRFEKVTAKATVSVPPLFFKDFDGDGDVDLAAVWDDEVDVYLRSRDGHLPQRPSLRSSLNLLTEKERRKALRMSIIVRSFLEDLDGDQKVETIFSKTKVRGLRARNEVFLFSQGKNGGIATSPSRVLATQGFVEEPMVGDVNGDGLLDLCIPSIPTGATNFIRFLFFKRVNFRFDVYLFRRGEGIGKRPDFHKTVGYKLDFASIDSASEPVISLKGDFNGDGLRDLLFATGKEELCLLLGSEEHPLGKKVEVSVPTSGLFQVIDLNRDGKSDLLFRYNDVEALDGKVAVLLSR